MSRLLSAAALALAAVLLTACTSSDPASGPLQPVGETAPDAYAARPIPSGQVDTAINGLDQMVTDVLQRTGVPGMSVAVVRGGEIVYAKGFGVRELGKEAKVDADTVFQLASVSKSVGSTCVSAAVTKKLVSWSDPVTTYLPDFALSDPEVTKRVTIADLYAHRSGLPYQAGDDLEAFGFDRAGVLAKLRQFELDPFRISYHYSNFGLTAGAQAAAAAAKRPWEQLCSDLLYTPLGMTSTSSTYADFTGRENRATLHFRTGDKAFEARYTRDADAQSPAGGVSSSANDMARWLMMNLADGKVGTQTVIDPDALRESHTAQIATGPLQSSDARSRFYGYGFNVENTSTGHVRLGHSGAFYVGAGTAFALLPGADVGIVALTNASPVGAAEAVTLGFTDLVRTGAVERDWLAFFTPIFGALFVNGSKVADPPPTNAAPARPLDAYVGTYTNAYMGDVGVSRNGDQLTLTIGPKHLSAPLTHYDGDTFSWLAPGGNGEPVSAVTFAGGTDRARSVDIELVQRPHFERA
ncbi:serine hydrolase [Micropruina sp.]|uniref:serine hydrolase n=1 Tax=Micropruina sp. TaxID=2737536 RepID=UPI0026310208|nr:serine hydrolase [Micropruina sp.]